MIVDDLGDGAIMFHSLGQGSEWSDRSSPEEKTDWSVKKGGGD